jgi:hypothetical protein
VKWAAWLFCVAWLVMALPAGAASGKVVKVLPEFLDLKGRNSLAPSLYERDAYQAILREHPERRSGQRFYVQWKLKGPAWEPLTLRYELRGVAEGNLPKELVHDQPLKNPGGRFSHWAEFTLTGEEYKKLGAVTAWRVTLWEGTTFLGEQRSFLW